MKLNLPDSRGYFGNYGGKFIPETLIPAVEELEMWYMKLKNDESFQRELDYYLKHYVGRPTPLYFCREIKQISWWGENLSKT
jgi:tryptophan synthase beta chain